jgi:uncharacterized repeat protein (TIGR03803 family)
MNRRLLQRQRDFFNAISAVMAMLCVTTALAGLPAQAQTFTVLHNFSGGADGKYPQTTLTLDRGGNLYGTTNRGGLDYGTIFRLTNRGSSILCIPFAPAAMEAIRLRRSCLARTAPCTARLREADKTGTAPSS